MGLQSLDNAINLQIEKLPRYNGTVYRGLSGTGAQELTQKFKDLWANGTKEWTNTGAASTSISINVARKFDGDLILIIKNKTGGWIKPVSEYSHELEVLIMAGKKYKMTAEPFIKDDRYIVELEEI